MLQEERFRALVQRALGSQGADTSDNTDETKKPAVDPPAPSIAPAIAGKNFLDEALKNPTFRANYEKLGALWGLLRYHLRPSNMPANRRESVLKHKGFNKEIAMKYLLGLFGGFDNPDMRNETGIRALLEEKTIESEKDKNNKKLPAVICNHVLQLQKCGDDTVLALNKLAELNAKMLRLKQLWNLDDITDIHRVAIVIALEEIKQKKWLTYEEQLRVAGITERVSPQERVAALAEDLAELDRMIAENQGNLPATTFAPPAPATPTPVQPATPVQTAPNTARGNIDLNQFNREILSDPELMVVVGALTQLFAKIKDPNINTAQLVDDIDATNAAQGNLLGSAMDVSNSDNFLKFLAGEHAQAMDINNNNDLKRVIKAIHKELKTKKLY